MIKLINKIYKYKRKKKEGEERKKKEKKEKDRQTDRQRQTDGQSYKERDVSVEQDVLMKSFPNEDARIDQSQLELNGCCLKKVRIKSLFKTKFGILFSTKIINHFLLLLL